MPKLLSSFVLLALGFAVAFSGQAAAEGPVAEISCHDSPHACFQCLPGGDIDDIMDKTPEFLTTCVDPQQ